MKNIVIDKDWTGYCVKCEWLPIEPLPNASKDINSKCFGCWCTEEKPNWILVDANTKEVMK